jgi:hypothetical protein
VSFTTLEFELTPILAIGSSVWQPACHGSPGWNDRFRHHEVGWTGACGVNDTVFDGCLQVDGDADPTAAPHTPLVPVDLRFGNPGDMEYRDRLAAPAGRALCNPKQAPRQRRAVGCMPRMRCSWFDARFSRRRSVTKSVRKEKPI